MKTVIKIVVGVILFVVLWQLLNLALENLLEEKTFRIGFCGFLSGVVSYVSVAILATQD